MSIGSGHHGNHDDALTPEERALADRLARLGPQGEPSPALDARILAAARAAASAPVAAAPTHRAWRRRQRRWPVAFGAAATLAIVGGLAWQLRPVDDLQVGYSEAPRAASGPSSADAGPAPRPAQQAMRARVVPPPAAEAAPAAAGNTAPAAGPVPVPTAPPEPAASVERFTEAPARADAQSAPKAYASKPPVTTAPPVVFDEPSPMDTAAPPAQLRQLAPPALPAPPPPAPPTPAAPAPRAANAFPQGTASGNAAAAGSTVESGNKARAQRAKTSETAPPAAPAPQVASGAAARPAKPADAAAAADAGALDRVEVTNPRIDVGEDRAEGGYAGDQPLDDQPPASVDSPQVQQAWLQRVRQLVAQGRPDAARDSLREYQRRYPKAILPDDLRALLAQ
jgi:hypothetical protein